jgi:hypothetical protein
MQRVPASNAFQPSLTPTIDGTVTPRFAFVALLHNAISQLRRLLAISHT